MYVVASGRRRRHEEFVERWDAWGTFMVAILHSLVFGKEKGKIQVVHDVVCVLLSDVCFRLMRKFLLRRKSSLGKGLIICA